MDKKLFDFLCRIDSGDNNLEEMYKKLGRVCELHIAKRVSHLIKKYDVTLDTIRGIAQKLKINYIENKDSILLDKDYEKIEARLKDIK